MAKHSAAQEAQRIIESNFRIVNKADYKTIQDDGIRVPNRSYFHTSSASDNHAQVGPGYTPAQAIQINIRGRVR